MIFRFVKIQILLLLLTVKITYAVHESLNFVLQPMTRRCFYEDFEKDSFARLIEGI